MASTPPQIFAPTRRAAVRRRMHQRQQLPTAAHFLFDDVAEDLAERLAFLRHTPARTIVIGDAASVIAAALPGQVISRPALDLETPWPEAGFDLIAITFALDTANDLPGALIHARNALAPGGLLLATMLGFGSLPALRAIMLAADADRPAPRIHPQVDVRAAAQLLQRAGLSDPVADGRALDVRYRFLGTLVSDLRDHGLGNVLIQSGAPLGKAAKARADATFTAASDGEGRMTEHFELLTLSGWRRP